jgi:hypothetical protein
VGKDTRPDIVCFLLPWAEDGQTLTALSHSERFIFPALLMPRNIFVSKVYGGLLLQA